jgi:hypothetical protein
VRNIGFEIGVTGSFRSLELGSWSQVLVAGEAPKRKAGHHWPLAKALRFSRVAVAAMSERQVITYGYSSMCTESISKTVFIDHHSEFPAV